MSSRAKKAKVRTPEQIAAERAEQRRRDFEAVSLPGDAAALPVHATVQVDRESQVTVERARRMDAFDALKDGMQPGAYDAARRLERDLLTARGEHDRGRSAGRVDNGRKGHPTLAMIAASGTVKAILSRVGERDGWLLAELIAPSVPIKLRCSTWREIVAHITGESHAMGQGAVVRSACANLLAAQQAFDRGEAAAPSGRGC